MKDTSDTNPKDEDEAALIDAFFLPGGILDPLDAEVESNKGGGDNGNAPPQAAVAAEPPSLLFASEDKAWLEASTTVDTDSSAAVVPSTAANSTGATTPWFGQGLLLGTSVPTEEQPTQQRPLSDLASESVGLSSHRPQPLRNKTSSVGEIDAAAFSAVATGLLQQHVPHQRSSSQPNILLHGTESASWHSSLPQGSHSQEEEEVLSGIHKNDYTGAEITTDEVAATITTQTIRNRVTSRSPMPGPPPGFETALSAESPSFTPSTGVLGTTILVPPVSPQQSKGDVVAGSSTTTSSTNEGRPKRKSAVSGGGEAPSTSGNGRNKNKAKSTPYRQAVVGNTLSSKTQTPRRGKTKKQSSSKHSTPISRPPRQSQSDTTEPLGGPSSSSHSVDEDFHVIPASSNSPEDLGWSEIVPSPSKQQQTKSLSTKNSKDEEPEEPQQLNQSVRNEPPHSLAASAGSKTGGSKNPKSREVSATDHAATGQARNKHNGRRQHQQHGGKNESNRAEKNEPREHGEANVVLNLLVSMNDVFQQVLAWTNEILFPALKHSLLTMALSALHSLRGIFLLFLAAFHAYSFAADETLAQLNLESCWIPYVSLIYAPTATRHAMNFIDLPHFTPHLVSSFVLCFLFRRPTGLTTKQAANKKLSAVDLHHFLLRCCQLFIPFDLCMDGFSSVNTSIMTLSYTDRLLLAYVICTLRKGWLLVPCAWLSFAVQCLVAAYFPWRHILAEPILLFILFSIGMASLNVLRILDHWKLRAKKAKNLNS